MDYGAQGVGHLFGGQLAAQHDRAVSSVEHVGRGKLADRGLELAVGTVKLIHRVGIG